MKPYTYIIEHKYKSSNTWHQHWNYKSYLSLDYANEAWTYIKDSNFDYRIVPLYRDFSVETVPDTESKIMLTEEQQKEIYSNYKRKRSRFDFEFTPFTFWQLFPSIAINLNSKELEFTWLCFGMYYKFKRWA